MRRDIVIAVLAIAALLGVSLLTAHQDRPAGATRSSGDYAYGGYRGWYELLGREGIAVERFREHHDALGASGIDTLIVAFPNGAVPYTWDAGERDALRAWVRGGGHLIDVGVTPAVDKNDGKGELLFGSAARPGSTGALRGPWSASIAAWQNRGAALAPEPRVKLRPREPCRPARPDRSA